MKSCVSVKLTVRYDCIFCLSSATRLRIVSNSLDTVCVKFESYFGMASDRLRSEESVPV
jgi:hypothetical protein